MLTITSPCSQYPLFESYRAFLLAQRLPQPFTRTFLFFTAGRNLSSILVFSEDVLLYRERAGRCGLPHRYSSPSVCTLQVGDFLVPHLVLLLFLLLETPLMSVNRDY